MTNHAQVNQAMYARKKFELDMGRSFFILTIFLVLFNVQCSPSEVCWSPSLCQIQGWRPTPPPPSSPSLPPPPPSPLPHPSLGSAHQTALDQLSTQSEVLSTAIPPLGDHKKLDILRDIGDTEGYLRHWGILEILRDTRDTEGYWRHWGILETLRDTWDTEGY